MRKLLLKLPLLLLSVDCQYYHNVHHLFIVVIAIAISIVSVSSNIIVIDTRSTVIVVCHEYFCSSSYVY